jgi:hypothetical protein
VLHRRWLVYLADQHDVATHCPEHPATRRAYESFCEETERQFWLLRKVIRIALWQGKGEPYRNSAAMLADVRSNAHLWVLKTGEIPADHRLAQPSSISGFLLNDCFRATHDLTGHAPQGHSFSARGEEGAYQEHALLFPAEAIPALVAETRMQNAWVLCGAHLRDAQGRLPQKGDPNYIPVRQRPFPAQKAFAARPQCISYDCWKATQTAIYETKKMREGHHGRHKFSSDLFASSSQD